MLSPMSAAAMALRRRPHCLVSLRHRLARTLSSEASAAAEPSPSHSSAPDSPVPGRKVLESHVEEFEVGGKTMTLETGMVARFANGSAVLRMGGTAVIATAVCSKSSDAHHDFLPLTVDYREKQYARGVIPTTFMRREGAPKERELICGRIIDRPIRPLFPSGFYHEVQITASVHSSDGDNEPDVLAANAASSALMLSDIPWNGPIGLIRLGRIDGKFIFYPTVEELSHSDLNLIYACTHDKTLMVDVQAREITEGDLKDGLKLAHAEAIKCIPPQIRLAEKLGKCKKEYKLYLISENSFEKIRSLSEAPIEEVFTDPNYGKFERGEALEKITHSVKAKLQEESDEDSLRYLSKAVDTVRKKVIRRRIMEKGLRVDGRQLDEVRPLYCKAEYFPKLHGSALFNRGDTQVLCYVTLGAPGDAQRLDSIVGPPTKRFMLHYSFPPFSINEVAKHGGLNRREVGHGTLAEKALLAVLPPEDEFPYAIRVNSEVMASDGSTSMASVCGGSMALMDAGIPVREHAAGVSVGLVSEIDPVTGDITDYRILTDILGLEDHSGDMDFKIAGTRKGVTAIQLDIKPAGIPLDIICECLEPARRGRVHIIDRMEEEISEARSINDDNTPRLATLNLSLASYRKLIIHRNKIADVPGARICASNRTVTIIANSQSSMDKAIEKVEQFAGRETEVGKIYKGVVTAIKEYGAFVDFNGGQLGLLHISELSKEPVSKVSDILSVGQELSLMCIELDVRGNIKLSLKAAQAQLEPDDSEYKKEVTWPSIEKISVGDAIVTYDDDFSDRDDAEESLAYDSQSIVVRSSAECDIVDSLDEPYVEVAASVSVDDAHGGDAEVEPSNNSDNHEDGIEEPTPSSPSVLIRSSAECDIADGLLTRKSMKVAKSTPKPYTQTKKGAVMKESLALKNLAKRLKKKEKRKSTSDEADSSSNDEHGLVNFLSKLSTQVDRKMTPGPSNGFSSQLLRLGDNVTAKVNQIRAHGLVLELTDGEQGMLKFEGDGRRDFKIGEELQVKCSSFSTKGIPVFTLLE